MKRREDSLVDAEVGMPHVRALDGALEGKRDAAEALSGQLTGWLRCKLCHV
jgi:hypothetical protein